jgi:hypothetical protein
MRDHDDFMRSSGEQLVRGQQQLATAMRALVASRAPEIYPHVADAGDDLFLEPLLFAHFASSDSPIPLAQLLWGALPPEARPDAVDVRTDDEGRAYVPGVGYFHSALRDRDLVLHWDRGEDRHQLRLPDGDDDVPSRFEPPLLVPGTRIELVRHAHPLLSGVYPQHEGTRIVPALGDAPARHAGHLARALEVIASLEPALHDQISRTTRRIVVFNHPEVVSFATVAAHGIAFFSPRPDDDEVFFIDDLPHQCGHVAFNAISARRADLFRGDPDARLGDISGNADDRRTLYGAFHGFFTEYHMCRVLDRCDRSGLFGGRQAHELLGRLAFIAQKYFLDTTNLDQDVYTEAGRSCFEALRAAGRELDRRRPELRRLVMDGQPYVFDYALFARSNPLPRRAGPGRPALVGRA